MAPAKQLNSHQGGDAAVLCRDQTEAYKGRGQNDPLGSHDIEDMLTLIDGRPELLDELTTGPLHIANYIALELQALLSHNNFDYAIKDAARNDSGREELLFTRIEKLALQQS